jgi:peptidoglycan hydrolase CwlO-like protein
VLGFELTPAARSPGRAGLESGPPLRGPAFRGGALEDSHSIRRLATVALMTLCCVVALTAAAAAPAGARTGDLQKDKAKAQKLAEDVAALDRQIATAVTHYSRAARSLEAVRGQIRDNRHLQRFAHQQLRVARATLAARAVAMYKHEDVSALDAVFSAASFGDLVTQLTMVSTIARSDHDVVRMIETTKRQLNDRAASLAADERTSEQLVETCRVELATIRGQLDERRAVLVGVRADIKRLVTVASRSTPTPGPTVEPPGLGGGSGPWWPLIRSSAAANGVSARGMYRLMMVESGGSASIIGRGGFCGLFQYSPGTWKGDWNPWRSSSISDGAAQIKATALALKQGHGHAWWDPSYTWAFEGT